MKVKLAKTAGFCMGVRRAMELVLAEANRGDGPLYTFGPLIHNKQVLDLLESKGVNPIEDLNRLQDGRIVIRAHGIPPQKRLAIKKTGLKVIDATCPKVAQVHSIIRYHTNKGYKAIIVGDKDHAEVVGLIGYSKGPAYVIQGVKDVSTLPNLEKLFVVAQTTQEEQNYHAVVTALRERFPGILVFYTICDATHQRQQEVRSFANQVDAVVVVGGLHSGNTQRLAQVSKEEGMSTFHVETDKDLDKKKLIGMKTIGVTAGASTPNWMIKNVVSKIEGLRGGKESPFKRWAKRIFKSLVLSNLLVATGALSFTFAVSTLIGRDVDIIFPLLTFLYIYAMHVLNRFLDKGASAYNDPERAAFLKKHRYLLITTATASIAIALVLSLSIGLFTFLAMIGLILLGIVYSVPLIPKRFRYKYTYSKIKDIPGSRSLSESLAWVAVISVLPLLGIRHIVWSSVIIAALIVFTMSFARSIIFDVFQVQGDLIVGTETLPITLGEKKCLVLLKITLLFAGFMLGLSPLFGLASPFSYLILFPLFGLSLCLLAYERHWLYPGPTLEALVESNFFLTGLLACIWQVT